MSQKCDQKVVEFLKKDLFQEHLSVAQIAMEMQKWSGLLSRRYIASELKSESETILNNLFVALQEIKQDFESSCSQLTGLFDDNDTPHKVSLNNMSPTVSSIIWTRTL